MIEKLPPRCFRVRLYLIVVLVSHLGKNRSGKASSLFVGLHGCIEKEALVSKMEPVR